MIKKIILSVLLVGFTGVLIWGGVNRTLARASDRNSPDQGRNQDAGKDQADGLGAGESHGNGKSDSGPSNGQSRGSTSGAGGNQGGGNRVGSGQGSGRGQGKEPLDENEIQALHLALADEVHALELYQSLIVTFGSVEPFVELAQAEQHHIDALLKHYDKHGIPVPENPWQGNIPAFESIQEACQAGAEAEIENVALYEQLLSMTDEPGLIQVFSSLSRASQEHHLPELMACQ